MNFIISFITIFTLLSGPVLASFLTALTMRQAKLTKASEPRSQCDHCGHRLTWFEMIPVFSFLWQRGKCRYCGHKINWKIWLMEVLGLMIYALLAWFFWSSFQTQPFSLESSVLVLGMYAFVTTLFYLSIFDLLTYSLPARATTLLLAEGLLVNCIVLVTRLLDPSAFMGVQLGNLDNLLLGVVGYFFFFIIIKFTKQKAMGVGDMYIACACGLMLGWPLAISWFYMMLFSATAFGLILAARRKKLHNLLLPLVPFMLFGYVIAITWGADIFRILFPRPL